jgi:hypothetical protein
MRHDRKSLPGEFSDDDGKTWKPCAIYEGSLIWDALVSKMAVDKFRAPLSGGLYRLVKVPS